MSVARSTAMVRLIPPWAGVAHGIPFQSHHQPADAEQTPRREGLGLLHSSGQGRSRPLLLLRPQTTGITEAPGPSSQQHGFRPVSTRPQWLLAVIDTAANRFQRFAVETALPRVWQRPGRLGQTMAPRAH